MTSPQTNPITEHVFNVTEVETKRIAEANEDGVFGRSLQAIPSLTHYLYATADRCLIGYNGGNWDAARFTVGEKKTPWFFLLSGDNSEVVKIANIVSLEEYELPRVQAGVVVTVYAINQYLIAKRDSIDDDTANKLLDAHGDLIASLYDWAAKESADTGADKRWSNALFALLN